MTNEFDLIEHPLVLLWFKDFLKTDPLGVVFLTEGHVDFFNSKWGKSTGATQNLQYWKRDYLGITIYVYSDEKITFYKAQYLGDRETFIQDKKMGSYLTGFLTKLTKEFFQ